jgi:hypothetical protein
MKNTELFATGEPRYEECAFSAQILPRIKEIVEILISRGFKVRSTNGTRTIYLSKPEAISTAYIGTFVNQFSFSEKVWWYADKYTVFEKNIFIHEVTRGNGTEANKSIEFGISVTPGAKKIEYPTWPVSGGGKLNEFGVEIPKTFDTATGAGGGMSYHTRVKKVRVECSEKMLMKAIDETIEKFESTPVEDQSKFAKDPKDFPADNTEEYYASRGM